MYLVLRCDWRDATKILHIRLIHAEDEAEGFKIASPDLAGALTGQVNAVPGCNGN
jgi:hypothetical protein